MIIASLCEKQWHFLFLKQAWQSSCYCSARISWRAYFGANRYSSPNSNTWLSSTVRNANMTLFIRDILKSRFPGNFGFKMCLTPLSWNGYINVGDGCWRRFMLVTLFRYWWPILYIEKVTNVVINITLATKILLELKMAGILPKIKLKTALW